MVFPFEHINGLIGKISFGLYWVRESTVFKITQHDDHVFTVDIEIYETVNVNTHLKYIIGIILHNDI